MNHIVFVTAFLCFLQSTLADEWLNEADTIAYDDL